jgi:hypothetical protein
MPNRAVFCCIHESDGIAHGLPVQRISFKLTRMSTDAKTPDYMHHLQTFIQMVQILDQKIDALSRNIALINEIAIENVDASSINGPQKMRIRDEVRAYIATCKDFKAHSIPGGYASRLKLLSATLNEYPMTADDVVLEFGVFRGKSLSVLSQKCPGAVYGFDSFEGLPESAQIWQKGIFYNPEGLAYPVGQNVKLVKGWFKDTIAEFVKQQDMSKVKLVHIDCDIYSSAKEIFETIGPHLAPETLIVFDEYWNYEGWQEGEFKAFHEFIGKSGRTYTYLAYMDAGHQVAVRLH